MERRVGESNLQGADVNQITELSQSRTKFSNNVEPKREAPVKFRLEDICLVKFLNKRAV